MPVLCTLGTQLVSHGCSEFTDAQDFSSNCLELFWLQCAKAKAAVTAELDRTVRREWIRWLESRQMLRKRLGDGGRNCGHVQSQSRPT